MTLAELVEPNTARFNTPDDLRLGIETYLSQGAIGVKPSIPLRPMQELDVLLTLGSYPIHADALRVRVVLLQSELAVLQMISPPADLVSRARKLCPRDAPDPITLDSGPTDSDPRSDAGVFSEPSFEEVISRADQAPVDDTVFPAPRYNVESKVLRFDDEDHARHVMQQMRTSFAILGECLRIPKPARVKLTFDVEMRRSKPVPARVFPGPQGGVVIQPEHLEQAMGALDEIINQAPRDLWDISGTRPLYTLSTASAFLQQPMVRKPTPFQMSEPTLPLLLRAMIKFPAQRRVRFLADEHVHGELYTDGQRAMSAVELDHLTRAVKSADRVEITPATTTPSFSVHASLTNVLGAALRRQLTDFSVDELLDGMTAQHDKVPKPIDKAGPLLKVFGLPDPFRRSFLRLEQNSSSLISFTASTPRSSWELIYILQINAALTWS